MEYFAHMPEGKYWVWLAFSTMGATAGFYFAFRNLGRARIIEDTPTAKVRSAHQGYVELAGDAQPLDNTPLFSPLTQSACCWYRYSIERHCGKNNWNTVEKEFSSTPFILRDETGDCIIDPEGAEISPTDRSIWYGRTRHPEDRNPPRKRLDSGNGLNIHGSIIRGNYRYTEERIYPNDSLYALGLFKSLDDIDHQHTQRQMLRELLREWKQDTAGLLARFDTNKDGKIDIDEWDRARAAAAEQSKAVHKEQLKTQILHTLSKTASSRRPYLISSLPQFNLVRRYRLLATLSIAGFFIAGSLATWMLASRFI